MSTSHPPASGLPDGWDLVPFTESIRPIEFSKPRKILARDYRSKGRIPVVDQGQGFIAGWTDDEDAALTDGLPLVVFGDHTRAFKFVDFPFALGADGTQLLKPAADFDPRFFFYACRHLSLPSRGYNRHFRLLKEQLLPRPPRGEQSAIADRLHLVERAIETEGRRIEATTELMAAARTRLFEGGIEGRSTESDALGRVPDHWIAMPISEFGEVVTGTTPKTSERGYYHGGVIPFIAPGDLGRTTRIYSSEKHITELGLGVSRRLPRGSVCFVCIGSSIGKVGITTHDVAATNQQINAIIPSAEHVPLFVCYLLQHFAEYIASHASPSPVPIMSKSQFQQIQLSAPRDLEEQQQIARTLEAIDTALECYVARREKLRELFTVLLHKLVGGETRVTDLNVELSRPVT